jgi:putative tricarboxylic transport membrane protein
LGKSVPIGEFEAQYGSIDQCCEAWNKLVDQPWRIMSPFDVTISAIFGVIGYWLIKYDFEPPPMLLGFVLGPLMEENLRRAMLIARGDWTVFFTRPISAVLLGVASVLLVIAALPKIRRRRDEVFVE